MGIPVELFVDSVPQHLICSICQLILERGTLSGCSEDHPFCLQCVRTSVRQRATCPTCLQPTSRTRLRESQLLRREVGSLRARCSEDQCDWQGDYSELQAHLDSTCSFHPRPCRNRPCQVLVSALQLFEHLDITCAYTIYGCSRGGEHCGGFEKGRFTREAGEAAHDVVCEAYRCPNMNCTTVGSLRVQQAHAPGCARTVQYALDLHHSVQALKNELAQARQHIAALEASNRRDSSPCPTGGLGMDWASKGVRARLPSTSAVARAPMDDRSNDHVDAGTYGAGPPVDDSAQVLPR